ncbi:MAG: hypothetical protein LBI96_04920 [Odoribacteraceae bacterium]|jgi:hypothetical protein|nr:hypothetical protein [Odoribacteraceae bacterium]
MAKKRKQQSSQQNRTKQARSKSSVERKTAIIQKILLMRGRDPHLLDRLTKAQRQQFLFAEVEPPKFVVTPGCRVPRQLVSMMHSSVQRFLRERCYGDPAMGLTYLDLVTVGLGLFIQAKGFFELESPIAFSPEQQEVIDSLYVMFQEETIWQMTEPVGSHMRDLVLTLSKMNFRVYGFDWPMPSEIGVGYAKSTFVLTSEECEEIYFQHENKRHKAFRVKFGQVCDRPAKPARIDQRLIYPTAGFDLVPWLKPREKVGGDHFDVYIQSHALQRIKERVDIFPAHRRNFRVMLPLVSPRGCHIDISGGHMIDCGFDDTVFGYYPFITQGEKIFILTFLPLISPGTVHGANLIKRFKMRKEDFEYLGMDKLSFFRTVDFDQVPVLRDALMETGLEYMLDLELTDCLPFEIDQKKTAIVKKFFEHFS